ncbi:dimethyladenosine transferase [Thermanaerovibrio velox DSM 12556]|uniref:Dimethyladenosine transferase n=1 Tax=Thermanaerovibrio velox DSM 12556 TaxID=926567 RepID=H0US40_9BACT|nr:16S rRNA (adenine(1518)-N(6)/adenine(1519)-N(6))-dimethyltransferase RsmA [Thermanaerovibrio velox]EHM10129.1 dimethyladenosine transferase [Thermanaerovibrio velox DSM 12556]
MKDSRASNYRFKHNTDIGQNFLVNQGIVENIVKAAEILDGEVVLEVGPGKGILSRQILKWPCSRLISIEVDHRLSQFLDPLTQEDDRVTIIWEDALRMNFLKDLPCPPSLVIANLPYHITTPIVWKFLEELAPQGLTRMVLMVQREAAVRMIQQEGSKDRCPLGITLEAMGMVRKVLNVPPGAFRPIPKVQSSVIRIDITANRQLPRDPNWRRMLKISFAQRRKTLINNWGIAGIHRDEGLRRLISVGLRETTRAEEVPLNTWLKLSSSFQWSE